MPTWTVLASLLLTSSIIATIAQPPSCNICGEGNSIQYPQGVVAFTYEDEDLKNNCQTWQRIVNNNPFAISNEFCKTELLQYTYRVCRCTTAEGKAVEWTPAPTASPTSSASTPAASTAFPTEGSESGIGAPTELPLEWFTPSTPDEPTTPSPVVILETIPTVVLNDDEGRMTKAPVAPTAAVDSAEEQGHGMQPPPTNDGTPPTAFQSSGRPTQWPRYTTSLGMSFVLFFAAGVV